MRAWRTSGSGCGHEQDGAEARLEGYEETRIGFQNELNDAKNMANQVWARQQQAELRGEAAAARTRAATEARQEAPVPDWLKEKMMSRMPKRKGLALLTTLSS